MMSIFLFDRYWVARLTEALAPWVLAVTDDINVAYLTFRYHCEVGL